MHDVFGNVNLPSNEIANFSAAVKEACDIYHLKYTDDLLCKLYQLYEMSMIRHGIILMGQQFAGKTTAYTVLAKTLNILHRKDKRKTIYSSVYLTSYKQHITYNLILFFYF